MITSRVARILRVIEYGGQASGNVEIANTDLSSARNYAEKLFQDYQDMTLEEAIPNFDSNYNYAQRLANVGFAYRRDMPVIDERDVKLFQRRLEDGYIDINPPHAELTAGNPFPEGLRGNQADNWLEAGLPIHDRGQVSDDVVNVSRVSESAGGLKPIQRQIYLDKSLAQTARNGISSTIRFLESTVVITSDDNYIIDGHHRWMAAVLIDPTIRIETIAVDLPIRELLPLALAYGDAIGNTRNA